MIGWMLPLLLGSSPPPCPTAVTELEAGGTWSLQQVAQCIEAEATPRTEHTSKWLAMKRIEQLDEPISDAEARSYSPTHRRLLTDAIHAHRGRQSPSAEHVEILTGFPWYTPNAQYTDQLLNAVDRENIGKLSHPPRILPDPIASRDPSVRESRGCMGGYGCTSAPIGHAGWFWGVLLLSLRRRAGGRPNEGTQTAAPLHPV
ncbi:MAG: hypothetical protein VX519_00990 [Myxococcota bacterium]|nr:hypothetical protein [Myxococcota bacterium]